MLANFAGEGRRLYDRVSEAPGLIVDADGASLGEHYPLVERWDGGYRAISADAAGLLLRTIFDCDDDPAPLAGLCRSIAKALDDGNLLRAQLLGLQIPMGRLDRYHLSRLAHLSAMEKAGYNPDQSRNAAGEWGFGAAAIGAMAAADTGMTTVGTASALDFLAEGSTVAAEATLGSALAVPILLIGGLLIPWSNSNVHEGYVIGHSDMAYRYDEGMLTLMHVDLDGGRTIVFQGMPVDGEYRDASGQLIGRTLPQGFDLAPEFLNAMSVPSDQAKSKVDARAATDDRPQICPDPSFASESMSARSAAYQTQITGLPPGLVVRYNDVKFDGCNHANGNLEEAKAPGFKKFMLDLTNWRDWFTGDKGVEDQMERQSNAAGDRHVDWYFAEEAVADYFRRRATEMKLTNVSVYYVPAVVR